MLYYQFNFCEGNDVSEGRIHLGFRLKVRVPLTLLDSPAMFYYRFVSIYASEMQLNPLIVDSKIRW